MPASEITLAELLQKSGYATACIGKWDIPASLGGCRPHSPAGASPWSERDNGAAADECASRGAGRPAFDNHYGLTTF
jgi:arylsulfatase A-like enzyme